MKITNKVEYALNALVDLSHHYGSGRLLSLNEIAMRRDIPVKYLEHIMLILKRGGYVQSKRGMGGGFFLARAPQRITVGDIVEMIEGPFDLFIRDRQKVKCQRGVFSDSYAFQEVWNKATTALKDILNQVTFADIMKRSQEIQQEQGGYMYEI